MKFVIAGRDYDVASLGKVSLFDLLELKKSTGIDLDTMQQRLTEFDDREKFPRPEMVMGSADHLLALGALVWLVRRRNGELLTLEQACDFPLDELEVVLDEDDVVEAAPDPQ